MEKRSKIYVAKLERDGAGWHAWVPELSGVRTTGETEEEVSAGIREAIAAAEDVPRNEVLLVTWASRAPTQGTLARCREERQVGVYKTPPGSISWAEHEEVWQAYSKRFGASQDALQIARRGGFGKEEAEGLLGRQLTTWVAQ